MIAVNFLTVTLAPVNSDSVQQQLLPPLPQPASKNTRKSKCKKTGEKKRSKTTSDPTCVCYECHVAEGSPENLSLGLNWIRCCKCFIWCHERCGEINGLMDDYEFLCAGCVQNLAE